MVDVRLTPMPLVGLQEWRASRRGTAEALPDPAPGEQQEALVVVLDDVAVGAVLVGRTEDDGLHRCSVRSLELALPSDATEEWAAVLNAIGEHARDTGARSLATAVPLQLASVFQAAGYRATVTSHAKRLDGDPRFQEDRRVVVRAMDEDERRQFAADARALLGAGTTRSGLLDPEESPARLEERLARLTDRPAPDAELLMVGTVEGEPVGRVWGTLVEDEDGLDFVGNVIELFPQFRGRRLTPSFLGAMARHLRELGVRDLRLRVHDHDQKARDSFLGAGLDIDDVHLRKDLD